MIDTQYSSIYLLPFPRITLFMPLFQSLFKFHVSSFMFHFHFHFSFFIFRFPSKITKKNKAAGTLKYIIIVYFKYRNRWKRRIFCSIHVISERDVYLLQLLLRLILAFDLSWVINSRKRRRESESEYEEWKQIDRWIR